MHITVKFKARNLIVTYSFVYHAQNGINIFFPVKNEFIKFCCSGGGGGFRTCRTSWKHPFCSFSPFSM